jgi:DNA mismatch endonuclease (patch repair protein)
MQRVRGSDTKPELRVRRLAHKLGYRFRLYRRELPGTPDLVFPSRRKVIFVHGCFWHQHDCQLGRKQPTTRREYWAEKFARNSIRNLRVLTQLKELGWDVLVIWECETNDVDCLLKRLSIFLGSRPDELIRERTVSRQHCALKDMVGHRIS